MTFLHTKLRGQEKHSKIFSVKLEDELELKLTFRKEFDPSNW